MPAAVPATPVTARPGWTRWGVAAGIVLLLGLVGGRWWIDSRPAPAVLKSVQLTQYGLREFSCLLTDGVRLYFMQQGKVVQVAVTGGTPVPFLEGLIPLAISTAGDRFLVSDVKLGTEAEFPLSTIRLPDGIRAPLGIEGHAGAWSPNNETLAYANGPHLYLAGKSSGVPKLLVTAPGRIDSLAFSPDGARIRYAVSGANDTLTRWEVSPDGRRPHEVGMPIGFSHDAGGSWTPDGRYYIFSRHGANAEELWAARESRDWLGRMEQKTFQLTDGTIDFVAPVPSRDGKKIFAIGYLHRAELMRYQPETGSFVHYLQGLSGDQLAYSPDGQSMVWVGVPKRVLWRSRADGGERIPLTSSTLEEVQMPRWSPDQKTIVFAARPAGKVEHLRLYRVPSAGGKADEVLQADYDQTNPNFTPDGKALYFGSAPWLHGFESASVAIRRIDLQTHEVRIVPGSEGLWAPKLSPDGRFMAAETLDSRAIKLCDLAAGTWTDLVKRDQVIGFHAWSHDGGSLYFNTEAPAIHRVDRASGHTTLLASLAGFDLTGSLHQWFGLAPDDSLLFLRDASIRDVFELDVRFP
jgi:Tol biopolymer transport system component